MLWFGMRGLLNYREYGLYQIVLYFFQIMALVTLEVVAGEQYHLNLRTRDAMFMNNSTHMYRSPRTGVW